MDISFFSSDVKHALEAEIKSLSTECTPIQRRRQDLEPFSALSTDGYVYGSSMQDYPVLEFVELSSRWGEPKVDKDIKQLRAEEMKLLADLEQAGDHWLLVYRLLRMRSTINTLRRVLRRRGKSALSRLPAETIRDIGQYLDLNARKFMCRFLYEICMVQ